MLLSLAEHGVELHQWDTKDEMLNHVEKCDGGMLTLGEDAAQEVEFYSAVVQYNYAARVNEGPLTPRCWGVALISEGHGLKPHLLMLPTRVLVFGFNHEAVGLSVDDRRILFRLSFDSLFRSFLYLEDLKTLLVLNEIGVVAVTKDGSELWRYENDVITECVIKDGHILIEFMDSPPARLSLLRGMMR